MVHVSFLIKAYKNILWLGATAILKVPYVILKYQAFNKEGLNFILQLVDLYT